MTKSVKSEKKIKKMTIEELYLRVTLLEQSRENFDFKRGVIAVRKLLDNYLDSLDD